MNIHLDEATHSYTVDGRIISLSVTKAIGEWRECNCMGHDGYMNVHSATFITKTRMDEARDFGKAVHRGCHLILSGGIQWDNLHPLLINPLSQYAQWVKDYKVKPIAIEKHYYSTLLDLAGTIDLVCEVAGFKGLHLVDHASGAYEMKGPQTAAYEKLYRKTTKYKGAIKRYALILPKVGSYLYKPLDNRYDWKAFNSMLYLRRYLGGK